MSVIQVDQSQIRKKSLKYENGKTKIWSLKLGQKLEKFIKKNMLAPLEAIFLFGDYQKMQWKMFVKLIRNTYEKNCEVQK